MPTKPSLEQLRTRFHLLRQGVGLDTDRIDRLINAKALLGEIKNCYPVEGERLRYETQKLIDRLSLSQQPVLNQYSKARKRLQFPDENLNTENANDSMNGVNNSENLAKRVRAKL